MKRIGLFIVLCSMATNVVWAGGEKKGFGIKAGLNLDQFKANGFEKNMQTNPTAGLFAYTNNKRYGIQIEALWSSNQVTTASGFYNLYKQYKVAFADSVNKGTFTFTNISIPLLINYKLGSRAWLQFGPQYTAAAKVVDKNNLLQSGEKIFKTNDVSGIVGLNFRIAAKVQLSTRYVFGLNNVNNIKEANNSWNNKAAQIHLGYRIF